MSQLKLTADGGGGTVAIKGPASTAGNAAIELTVPGTGNSTLATTATAGKILQVVQTVKKDKQTIQSTSLVDIAGMSVTITPSSASNKVLIRYCLSVFTGGQYWSMRLLRGSDSTIFIGDQNPSATNQSRGSFGSYMPSYVMGVNVTQELLDSPNTTSATTYKLQAYTPYSGTYIIGINTSPTQDNYSYMTNCVSTITAMEVAA
tara:strand:+ start:294 stop:905 length:612 start_codon:yes stop_codon:yes gene_type:complete